MDIQQFQAWLEDNDTDLGDVLALLKDIDAQDLDYEKKVCWGSRAGWSY